MALEPGCAWVLDTCPKAESGRERVVQRTLMVRAADQPWEALENRSRLRAAPRGNWDLRALTGALERFPRGSLDRAGCRCRAEIPTWRQRPRPIAGTIAPAGQRAGGPTRPPPPRGFYVLLLTQGLGGAAGCRRGLPGRSGPPEEFTEHLVATGSRVRARTDSRVPARAGYRF